MRLDGFSIELIARITQSPVRVVRERVELGERLLAEAV